MEMLQQDPHALKLEHGMILNVGIQFVLDKCFAAETAVTKYVERVQHTATSSAIGTDADTERLRNDSMHRSLHTSSGQAGLDALSMYSKCYDFVSDCWSEWRQDDDQKYKICLDVICVMQDIKLRLVEKLSIPKIEIFKVCDVPEGESFDEQRVRQLA